MKYERCEKYEKCERGVSLLEVLLGLAVVCILLVMSYRYYENYKRLENVARLQFSVAQIMDALNQYYFIHCQKGDMTSVTIPTLQEEGLLTKNIVNPWGNFDVSIQNNTLIVMAVFEREQVLVPFVSASMNGMIGDEVKMLNGIAWERLPSYSTGDLFMYPGRQITVMSKGLSSKLWVLNSELQIFTHQQSRNTC